MNADVQALIAADFGIDVANVLLQRETTNHHDFAKVLSNEASTSPEYLRTLAIKCYLEAIGTSAYQALISEIQQRA